MKRLVCAVLAFIIVLPLVGCDVMERLFSNDEIDDTIYVAFSNGDPETAAREVMSEEALLAQPLVGCDYRSSMMYDRLSAAQQRAYQTLEYAMENGYTNIFLDVRTLGNMDEVDTVLYALALDSPLLEQNLRYASGTFTMPFEVEDKTDAVNVTGVYISIDNFAAEWWEKKRLAIEQAARIVDDVAADKAPFEAASALYRYVAEHVDYETYEDDAAVQSYLYDALIDGASQCDGFANSLSLLLRLAGIENVEKTYAPKDDVGHTWNAFEIDGVWYNADATNADMMPSKDRWHTGVGFAFGDELQRYQPDDSAQYPPCVQHDSMPVDAHLSGISAGELARAVQDGLEAHDELWTLIVLESYNRAVLEEALQDTANTLHTTLYHSTMDCVDGKTVLYVCDTALKD